MHLVRYQVAVSIDGFIAPKDGSTGWLDPYGKVAWGFMGPWLKQIGGLIVGRATYDQAASAGQWMFGDMPALLMTSRALAKSPKSMLTSDDPADGLARLRAELAKRESDKDIWLFGGGVTAGNLLAANLIDLFELAVVPVALGEGKPLFAGVSTQLTFEAAGSQPIGMGVVVNRYTRLEKPAATLPKRRAGSRSGR